MPPRRLASWYYLNTNTVVLSGTRATSSGAYLNDAVGTAEVLDKDDNVVVGGEAQPLTYTPASQGEYTVQFPNTIAIPPGQFLKVRATLSKNGEYYRGILECKVVDDA